MLLLLLLLFQTVAVVSYFLWMSIVADPIVATHVGKHFCITLLQAYKANQCSQNTLLGLHVLVLVVAAVVAAAVAC